MRISRCSVFWQICHGHIGMSGSILPLRTWNPPKPMAGGSSGFSFGSFPWFPSGCSVFSQICHGHIDMSGTIYATSPPGTGQRWGADGAAGHAQTPPPRTWRPNISRAPSDAKTGAKRIEGCPRFEEFFVGFPEKMDVSKVFSQQPEGKKEGGFGEGSCSVSNAWPWTCCCRAEHDIVLSQSP